ncbi:MAG: acyltransferase domain-containing protein, partial [Myxococcales bacterium]|nr:acyltransferase domain-containing protein [Myxococcales bacterium]
SVISKPKPWTELPPTPRRIAISGFGLSGTNAHVILEQAPLEAPAPAPAPVDVEDPETPRVLVLSGRTEAALRRQATRLAEHVHGLPALQLRDLAYSLACHRSHFEFRAALIAKDRIQVSEQLAALAEGAPSITQGVAGEARRTVFVFPGQGSQWSGMAKGLYAESPVFRRHVDSCAAIMDALTDWGLVEALLGDPSPALLERVDVEVVADEGDAFERGLGLDP